MQARSAQSELPVDWMIEYIGVLLGLKIARQMVPANVARSGVESERREVRHHVIDGSSEESMERQQKQK